MAAAAILNFGKNVNNFGLHKDILHQIIWEDASRQRGHDYVTKSRNRKLLRVTSSNECLKHMCVDLSVYNRYLNQIWYRTQIPHYTNTSEWPNSHKLKIQDGGDHLTKSRNRKLIRETSSNERLEHKCVDLSDYRRHLNQILYRAQAPH